MENLTRQKHSADTLSTYSVNCKRGLLRYSRVPTATRPESPRDSSHGLIATLSPRRIQPRSLNYTWICRISIRCQSLDNFATLNVSTVINFDTVQGCLITVRFICMTREKISYENLYLVICNLIVKQILKISFKVNFFRVTLVLKVTVKCNTVHPIWLKDGSKI